MKLQQKATDKIKFLILAKRAKMSEKKEEEVKEITEKINDVQKQQKLLWDLEDEKNPELHFGQVEAFKLDLSLVYKDISAEICNNKSIYKLFKVCPKFQNPIR